ncbi:hypothetical protein ACFL54_03920 [Planctomycetota bacterium]
MLAQIVEKLKSIRPGELTETLLAFDGAWSTSQIKNVLTHLLGNGLLPGRIFLYRSHCSVLLSEFADRIDIGNDCLLQDGNWEKIDAYAYPLTQQWYHFQGSDGKKLTEYEGFDLGMFLEHTICTRWLPVVRFLATVELYLAKHGDFRHIIFALRTASPVEKYFQADSRCTVLRETATDPRDWTDQSRWEILTEYLEGFCKVVIPPPQDGDEPLQKRFLNPGSALVEMAGLSALQCEPLPPALFHIYRLELWFRTGMARIAGKIRRESGKIQERIEHALQDPVFLEQFDFPMLKDCRFLALYLDSLRQKFESVMWHMHISDLILKRMGVQATFVNSDHFGPKRILTIMANRLGLASFSRQHGLQCLINGQEYVKAKKIFLFGEHTRREYIKWNSPKQLVTSGNFAYDQLKDYLALAPGDARVRIAAEIGFDPARKIYSLFTQPFYKNVGSQTCYDEYELAMDIFLQLAKTVPEAQFIVKLHPAEGAGERYQPLLEHYGLSNIKLVSRCDYFTLIRASSFCASIQSTTLLEAMILEVPVVQFTLLPPWIDLSAGNAMPSVCSFEELLEVNVAIEKGRYFSIVDRESQGKTLLDHVFATDWQASERHLDVLYREFEGIQG